MSRVGSSHRAGLKYHIWLQLLGSSLTISVLNVKQQIKVSSWQRAKLLTLHWSVQIGKYLKHRSLLGGREGGKRRQAGWGGLVVGWSRIVATANQPCTESCGGAVSMALLEHTGASFNSYLSQQKAPDLATPFTNICTWCRAESVVGGGGGGRAAGVENFNYKK